MGLARRASALLLAACVGSSLPASAQNYVVQLVVDDASGLSFLDDACGIDNGRRIVFTAVDGTGSRIFVSEPDGSVLPVSTTAFARVYSGAAITGSGEVAARDRTQPALDQVTRWSSPVESMVIGKAPQHFDFAHTLVELNDAGVVVFSAIDGLSTILIADSSSPPAVLAEYIGDQPLAPVVANTGEVLVTEPSGDLVLFQPPSASSTLLQEAGVDLDVIGTRPGISPNGSAIAYTASLGGVDHVRVGFREGAAFTESVAAQVGQSGFDAIDHDVRVAIEAESSNATSSILRTALVATRSGAQELVLGLTSVDTGGSQVSFGQTAWSTVARAGDELDGSTITSITATDPLNAAGDLAFVVDLADGRRGVARAIIDAPNVSGLVLASPHERAPMEGVQVFATDGGNPEQVFGPALTDAAGSYELFLPPGAWTLYADIQVAEPGSGLAHTLRNYVDWDPNAAVSIPAAGSYTAPEIVFPEPVVLVGGLRGSRASMTALFDFLRLDPGTSPDKASSFVPAFPTVRVPSLVEDPLGYDATAEHSSAFLTTASAIEHWSTRAVEELLGPFVDVATTENMSTSIVAHGISGLGARVLAREDPDSATRVLSLDTPHGGSSLGEVLDQLAISEGEMNGISPAISLPPDELFGWNSVFGLDRRHERTWMLYSSDSDRTGLVSPDTSPFGLGRTRMLGNQISTVVTQALEIPRYETLVPTRHSQLVSDPERLLEYGQWLGLGLPAAGSVIPSSSDPEIDAKPLISLRIDALAGSSELDVIRIDPTVTEIQGRVLLDGLGAQISFEQLDNTVVPLESLEIETLAPGVQIHAFRLTNPTPGFYQVRLTAGGTSAATLRGGLFVDDVRRLTLIADPNVVDVGLPVPIQAFLEEGSGPMPGGGSFMISITFPSGFTTTGPLLDNGSSGDGAAGDGIYGGILSGGVTSQTGLYRLRCEATLDLASARIERAAFGRFVVRPNQASATGPPVVSFPDVDINGLLDGVRVTQTIAVSTSSDLVWSAELRGPGSDLVARLSERFTHSGGATTWSVDQLVPGGLLTRTDNSGPFTLTEARVVDLERDTTLIQIADPVVIGFAPGNFELPPDPIVRTVLPSHGPVRGGNVVTVFGSHLAEATQVIFAGKSVAFTATGHDTLQVTVPALTFASRVPLGAPAVDPLAAIRVITPWGAGTATGVYRYER